MRRARRFTTATIAMLAALWRPGEARAQAAGTIEPPRAEIWGAWAVAKPVSGGTLAVDYEYTQFILGGHSTLFPVTHGVRVRPSNGERAFGPYVGGDVHVVITTRVAIMAGVRVRLTSGGARTIQVVELVDPRENAWVPEVADVAAALDGQPLDLPGMRWGTLVGVKLFLR